MISPNIDSDCMKARLYYYDYLNRQVGRKIPENTFEHISRCRFCQDEIEHLDCLLEDADKDIEQKWRNSSIADILGLHFAYVDKPVSCAAVKPFLPSLLVDDLKIRIQTPITAHIADCRDCTEDIEKLKALDLSREQLLRLSQILAAVSSDNTIECSQVRPMIPSVVAMEFSQNDEETLKHVCVCPDCRTLLYRQREELRRELLLGSINESEFPCESVTYSDIFCYCLPFGIDPANDEYEEFRESLTSHLRSCPVCLEKIQRLHSCINDIAERQESGVVTTITFDEPTIIRDEPVTSSRLVSLKRYIKPTLAAAAVLLIGFALFFSIPSAKAVSLEQIYNAVEKAKNICISRFRPGEDKPWQKQWISSTLNVILYDNEGQYILWDYDNNQMKIKTKDGNIHAESILEDIAAEGKESFNGSFGLLPFSDVFQAKENAQWNRVENIDLSMTPNTEVYDLTWDITVDDMTRYYKWRVYADTTTNLPIRIEWYLKMNPNVNYTIDTIETVAYPNDTEISEFIQSTF